MLSGVTFSFKLRDLAAISALIARIIRRSGIFLEQITETMLMLEHCLLNWKSLRC